jgi:hypothetical protein
MLFGGMLLFFHFLFLRREMLGFYEDCQLVEGRDIEILGFLILVGESCYFFQIVVK